MNVELLLCNICLRIKPKDEFYKRRESDTGYRKNCRKCIRDLQNGVRQVHKKTSPDLCYIRPKAKHCMDCGQWKSETDFGRAPERKDGLRAYCKSCCASREKHRASANQPIPPIEKMCVTCKVVKKSSDFGIARNVSTGLRGTCSSCEYEKALSAGYHYKRYGLTLESYQALENKQGGKCAICKKKLSSDKGGRSIDHDHTCCPKGGSCGKCVRGLLCGLCNSALGFFQDSTDNLQSAITYLNEYQLLKKEKSHVS